MRWPMRRPWHAGDTITRPMVPCRSPHSQRCAVPTILPSRSATRPWLWANICSQSTGRWGQRCSADRACVCGRSAAVMGRSTTPSSATVAAGERRTAGVRDIGRHLAARKLAPIFGDIAASHQRPIGVCPQLASIVCREGGFAICCGLCGAYGHKYRPGCLASDSCRRCLARVVRASTPCQTTLTFSVAPQPSPSVSARGHRRHARPPRCMRPWRSRSVRASKACRRNLLLRTNGASWHPCCARDTRCRTFPAMHRFVACGPPFPNTSCEARCSNVFDITLSQIGKQRCGQRRSTTEPMKEQKP